MAARAPSTSSRSSPLARRLASSRIGQAFLVAAAALGGAALWVNAASRRAEREYPPLGRFLDVDGVRLHYVERGRGRPVVMLHGNMTMIEELDASGLIDLAAERYRVIAFDRPGYGRSSRPRDRVWTPAAQAELLAEALRRLGIERPVVVGHSFGTLVAVELALRHPRDVAALALLSGYFYPTARADVPLLSPPAVPVVGDVMRHTVAPLLGRLAWPGLLRVLFGPAPISPRFDALKALILRSGQIRASASESAILVPAAAAFGEERLASLAAMPVVILAGAEDRFVGTEAQSERLHRALPGSEFRTVPGAGHMVHHTAPREAMAAIDLAARRSAAIAGGAHGHARAAAAA
jgi:pimeloyl-ACP methyl ester carboxylesterase